MDLLSEIEAGAPPELHQKLEKLRSILKNYEIESKMVRDLLDGLDEPAQHSCQCAGDLDVMLYRVHLCDDDITPYFCGDTIDQLKKCSTFIKLTEHCSSLKEFNSEDSLYLTDLIDQDYNKTIITNIFKILLFVCEKTLFGSPEKCWSVLAVYNFALKNYRYVTDHPTLNLAILKKWKECMTRSIFADYFKANVPSHQRWEEIFNPINQEDKQKDKQEEDEEDEEEEDGQSIDYEDEEEEEEDGQSIDYEDEDEDTE